MPGEILRSGKKGTNPFNITLIPRPLIVDKPALSSAGILFVNSDLVYNIISQVVRTMEQNKFSQLIQVGFLVVKVLVIVFAITGAAQLFKAVFKTVAFDEYPVSSYELSVPTPDGKMATRCEKEISVARKLAMLEDYSGAVSMLLVATGLFWLSKRKES